MTTTTPTFDLVDANLVPDDQLLVDLLGEPGSLVRLTVSTGRVIQGRIGRVFLDDVQIRWVEVTDEDGFLSRVRWSKVVVLEPVQ